MSPALIPPKNETVICTWFVSDESADATYFPQVGSRSDLPEAKAVYWRCTVCFFASSLALNPTYRHIFFTNTFIPIVDGVDISPLLLSWGVEIVNIPITYRLPKGSVKAWGNQFYIFDVLSYLQKDSTSSRYIVLDSDCLWLRSANEIVSYIDEYESLTYEVDYTLFDKDFLINGLSRSGMVSFLRRMGGEDVDEMPYTGGEIYAASAAATLRHLIRLKDIWPHVIAQSPDSPREEAHLLSILYALDKVKWGTANSYIRRMWTTFRFNDLTHEDANLTIWHLPSEKRTGFSRLFDDIVRDPGLPWIDAERMGLTKHNYARRMGWPRRTTAKSITDLALKIRDKIRSL